MPTHADILTQVAIALAALYYDKPGASRIAKDSGLDIKYIAFSTRPVDTWTSILEQAALHNRVDSVLAIAQQEYPAYQPLTDAITAYEQAPKTSATETHPEDRSTIIEQAAIALAALYYDKPSARRIARVSGLDIINIAFSTWPVDTWTSILEQAALHNRVDSVLAIAQQEYPAYQPLTDAITAYEQAPKTSATETQLGDRSTVIEQVTVQQRAFTELRNMLADIYVDQDEARRVCLCAGLDIRPISFRDRSVDTWDSVLDEATRQERVADLLFVAIVEYPENGPLVTAVVDYASVSRTDLPPQLAAALAMENGRAAAYVLTNLGREFIAQGLATALVLEDETDRVQALVALAPRLMDDLLVQGLIAAMAIRNEQLRSTVLTALAWHLSQFYGQDISNRGLSATLNIKDEQTLAQALTALAPHMPQALLAHGLTADLAVMDDPLRAAVVVSLLDSALLMQDRYSLAQALTALAPHLSGEHLTQSLVAAQKIEHDEHRAQVLLALVPRLSGEQKALALTQGLASIQAIKDARRRSELLVALAPYLSGKLWEQGLATALAIQSMPYRTQALAAFGPHKERAIIRSRLT